MRTPFLLLFVVTRPFPLFSAGLSRWSQYSLNGYGLAAGRVLTAAVLPCSETAFLPVFEVQLASSSSNATCLGVAALQQPALSYNDTIALIASIGATPQPMMVPAVCVPFATPPDTEGCSWNNVNLAYPAYSPVFVQPGPSLSDQSYWLGMWIAFLLLFVLSAPVVVYGMAVNCRDSPVESV